MEAKDFGYVSIRTEPKEGNNKCTKNIYGIFHKDKLLVFKKHGRSHKQVNRDRRIPDMMIGNYQKILGVELEVKHIPIMFE